MTDKELEELVYNWPTESKQGFNHLEENEIIDHIGREKMNMDKYDSAMRGNTCMMGSHGIISYHCDILTAIRCGLENRDMHLYEWD